MTFADRVPTKDRARGRWREILPLLGIDQEALSGKNGPCPLCGGTDRFRYLDRPGRGDGDGMWVCNQCQPHARPAMDLAIRFTGKPFRDMASEIDALLGEHPVIVRKPKRREPEKPLTFGAYARRVWNRGRRVEAGDPVDNYLRSRGVGMNIYPACIRTSPLDWHLDHDRNVSTRWPAMLALVHGITGQPIATHRTFLATDGSGKAPVTPARKMAGRHGPGPSIRLMPPRPTLGIAEGIETALSAAKLFQLPVWSVICAYGIETFEPPPGVGTVIVFADHDSNGTGQRAARVLADRLLGRVLVEVRLPGQVGTDFNDELMWI